MPAHWRQAKNQMRSEKYRALPVAADNLPYRIQPLSTARPYRKFQHKPLCIWTPGHLKPKASEQPTARAECQLPISGQFMNIEPRTLHVAELSLRIMSTIDRHPGAAISSLIPSVSCRRCSPNAPFARLEMLTDKRP
jgi:hypothetical protein